MRQDPYADIATPVQAGDPYADIALPISTNRNRRQAPPPTGPADENGEDVPFQPELLPQDNGIYPSAPLDTIGEQEAAANRAAFGNQATRLDPIDLQTLPAEDRAYLNAGMWVKFPNGEVRRLMRDARPGAPQPGSEEIRPGLFIEENSDVGTDIAKSLPTGVVEGLTGLAGMQGTIGQMIYGEQSLGQNMPGFGIVGPTGEQMNQAIRNQIGYDYYQPQTVAGEYSRTFGEFLPGALAPGSALARGASVAVPAFTSETAGQIARGMSGGERDTNAENFARLLGGLGGGFAVGGVGAVRGGADISLRNAAQGVTPQQLQMASALRDRAQAAGINMTNANALQQVTGGATGLGQLQRAVEGQSPLLQRYFAELPEQTRNAINAQLEQIGPLVEPSQLAGQAREAANRVLQNTRANINAQARPFYRAADDEVVSAEEYAALQEIPTYREAEAAFFNNPEMTPGVGGPQSVSAINRVIQEMDTLAQQADQGNMTAGANANLARVRGESAELAKGLVDLSSPSYAQARVVGAAGRQNELVPLQRGPIGSIAAQPELQPSLPSTMGVMFPNAPFRGQAQETARALELMGESVGGPLVRQHLDKIAMEAQQDLVSGPNQFGGANFAVRAFGNPEQRETVMQALDVVNRPDPNMAFPPINANAVPPRGSDPMANLVEILMATGQRHQGGSQTAFIQELQQQLRGGNLASGAAQTIANPPGTFGRIARRIDDLSAQANTNTLADLLMGSSEDFNARLTRALNRPRGANRVRAGVAVAAGQED